MFFCEILLLFNNNLLHTEALGIFELNIFGGKYILYKVESGDMDEILTFLEFDLFLNSLYFIFH